MNESFDFYNKTSLKSYNLNETMRYQLSRLDTLDVFTRKHCENVATITCNLCKKLHLSRGFTEYCAICAYLHDIGKLFIPSSILQKPGKLTDEEYETMKKHTTATITLCSLPITAMSALMTTPFRSGDLNAPHRATIWSRLLEKIIS